MLASRDCLDDVSAVASRLENWADDVWSEARRLARLSGKEETGSRMSSLARLGLGAITVFCLGSGSRCRVAALMAAAVRPTVAISIWSVLMMLSAVMTGFLAGLVTTGSDVLTLLSREAAPY